MTMTEQKVAQGIKITVRSSLTPQGIRSGNVNLDGVSQEIVAEKTEIVADNIVNDNVIANLIYKGFTRECCSNCHTMP